MTEINARWPYLIRSFCWVALTLVIVTYRGTPHCFADEPKESDNADLKTLVEAAAAFEIRVGDDGVPLEFRKTPVLRWPNATRATPFGGTFVWTRDERPEVIACFWEDRDGFWFAIQSLSTSKVVATTRGTRTFWRSEKPDVEFKKLDGAPPPAESAARRLSQMKDLAGRFRARVDVSGSTEELRLLPTPIYRYKTGDVVDGALFAFVEGTDPEAILHLEARSKGDKGAGIEWYYGFSRRTSYVLEGMLDDKAIWSAERSFGGANQPFFIGPVQ